MHNIKTYQTTWQQKAFQYSYSKSQYKLKEHFLLVVTFMCKVVALSSTINKRHQTAAKYIWKSTQLLELNTNLPADVAELWQSSDIKQKDGRKYEQESASNNSTLPRDEKLCTMQNVNDAVFPQAHLAILTPLVALAFSTEIALVPRLVLLSLLHIIWCFPHLLHLAPRWACLH